jgi:hypothetical protein
MKRQRVERLPGRQPYGDPHRAIAVLQLHDIPVGEPQPLRGARRDERAVVPGQLGEDLGHSWSQPLLAKRPS